MLLAPSVAALFKWRQFEPEMILLAVGWYLRFSLSYRATIDLLLSAKRDTGAAERFRAKAMNGANHPAPRVINTDKHAGYPPAIAQLKAESALEENLPTSTGAVPQ
jgi:transposase-like protein